MIQQMTEADELWVDILDARGVRISGSWVSGEIEKCKVDPVHFMNEYCLVSNRAHSCITYGHVADIKLYDTQEKYVRLLARGSDVALKKARQVGSTLPTCLFMLWKATFFPGMTLFFVARAEAERAKFLDELRFVQEHLPFFLRRQLRGTRTGLHIGTEQHSSRIQTATDSSNPTRGYTVDMLAMDDAAHLSNAEGIWRAYAPGLAANRGQTVIMSTPHEDHGLFYRIVEQTKQGKGAFEVLEMPWDSVPGRDNRWYDQTCNKLNWSVNSIKNELDAEFVPAG